MGSTKKKTNVDIQKLVQRRVTLMEEEYFDVLDKARLSSRGYHFADVAKNIPHGIWQIKDGKGFHADDPIRDIPVQDLVLCISSLGIWFNDYSEGSHGIECIKGQLNLEYHDFSGGHYDFIIYYESHLEYQLGFMASDILSNATHLLVEKD